MTRIDRIETLRLRTLSLVLLSLLMVACSGTEEQLPEAGPVRAIKYFTVGEASNASMRILSGNVQASESSQLSFQVGGQVTAIHVEVGDSVVKGQSLAMLDAHPYQLQVDTVSAELASAQAALAERQENYQQQQAVFADGFVSKRELDRARVGYQRAQSAVSLAQSRLELAKRDLEKTQLVSPFAGVVTRRKIEPFEDVAGSERVFEVQGTQGFEVALLLPSRWLSQIKRGARAEVELPALALAAVPALVAERSLNADSRGSYPITVKLENSPPGIQAGMIARVTLFTNASPGRILVPSTAVALSEQGQEYVFLYDPVQSIVSRRVVSSKPHGVIQRELVEGLAVGDIVAAAGVEFLREGQQVSLYSAP